MPDVKQKLVAFNADASGCTTCAPLGLIYDGERGRARPLLTREPNGAAGILIVGEAPNADDTFDPIKGHLTYDADTDPTGKFMRSLLVEEAGLRADEIDNVIFSNAVLCLPRQQSDKFPVTSQHMKECTVWLKRLIDDAQPTVVVTMGAVALRAAQLVERHRLELATSAGRLHGWYGRKLLPLYHAGRLGRLSRSEVQQRQDMRALRVHLGRDVAR